MSNSTLVSLILFTLVFCWGIFIVITVAVKIVKKSREEEMIREEMRARARWLAGRLRKNSRSRKKEVALLKPKFKEESVSEVVLPFEER
jgi:hypothetical protein